MVELVHHESHKSTALRVAIEGCGHGTLDSIYASIQVACEAKGWDTVDLVIIGGDFQAVRDRLDLNVTAMPAKYREMHDFHKYYWGNKFAPYLTIFIGGNHEASNHLFELYYGGWVAPNIYYLGAAGVIQFGPLKIAGMSGIWKGYDYRKPHYERLPYNDDDIYSIYHVRELDVRKLLAYRTQVDIALSHDWPQGIEWLGNHEQLFRYKRHLKEDAVSGKLGNVAAKQVLEHLRPQHWFSAHLHCRYAAVMQFDQPTDTSIDSQAPASTVDNHTDSTEAMQQQDMNLARSSADSTHATAPLLSAWQNFHTVAQNNEAREMAEHIRDQKARREMSENTGVPITAGYTFDATHKKLKLDNGLAKPVISSHDSGSDESVDSGVPLPQHTLQVDGCCESTQARVGPNSRRQDAPDTVRDSEQVGTIPSASAMATLSATAANPDAIDLDLSDDDDTNETSPARNIINTVHDADSTPLLSRGKSDERQTTTGSDEPEIGSVGQVASHPDPAAVSAAVDGRPIQSREASLKSLVEVDSTRPRVTPAVLPPQISLINKTSALPEECPGQNVKDTHENDVSEEMRAKLAALSSKFSEPEKIETSPALPRPEAISNKTTRFLALSKCAPNQNFLHLQEITSLTPSVEPADAPVKLCYDPEWLAILRVFAPELTLGGRPSDHVPKHRGDTYYRQRIVEEERWVQENVIERDLLEIPYNFEVMSTVNDASGAASTADMPREMSNPQTIAFCNLIGIDNKFNVSEEERDARMRSGPAPTMERLSNRGDFGGRGGRGGRGGGGFHHGRGRGGGGRGGRGGRGRGRGHY